MTAPAQEVYDRLAPVYDRRWASYTEATLRATLDGLDLAPAERVLDLAAGTGELTRRLLALAPEARVIGLDLSRGMLRWARDKPRASAAGFIQGSAGRLPFGDEAFDRVVCSNSFHHFDAPAAALAEVRRVLRPGGRLILTDWCDDYLSCKLCAFYLHLVDRSFRRAYTLRECRRRLEAAGFRVVRGRRFKIDWLWGLMRLDAERPD